MQHAEFLEALGVVQYRRRELRVEQIDSKINDTDMPGAFDEGMSEPPSPPAAESNRLMPREFSPDETNNVNSDPEANVNPGQEKSSGQKTSFDLLMWKTDRLLVWEIFPDSTGHATDKQTSASQSHDCHLLVNNILRSLWPESFKGAQMLQQSWPLPGVDASQVSAKNWLESMLSGHMQQAEHVPVWLMGESMLELILGSHAFSNNQDDSLIGSRVKHPQLDLEIFVGPSSQAMFDSPIAKARTWQLLRELQHG